MSVLDGSSSSQEEKIQGRSLVKRKDQKRIGLNGMDKDECPDHNRELLEYWCEEDSRLVCKECLIFGEHRGHTALTVEQRR